MMKVAHGFNPSKSGVKRRKGCLEEAACIHEEFTSVHCLGGLRLCFTGLNDSQDFN